MAQGRDWCILRCKGANTLKLAASLHAFGFDVWTPADTLPKRGPRGKTRPKDMVPVMPTYVFARARHLADLLEESQALSSEHPDFSVFHYFGKIPLIADDTLDPLRVAERKGTPIEKVARFGKGDLVKLTEGGFAGMSGVVELNRGQFTMVCFPGFSMPIKISSLLLLPDMAKDGLPCEGPAARRAA